MEFWDIFRKIVTLYICHFDLYLLATPSGPLSEFMYFSEVGSTSSLSNDVQIFSIVNQGGQAFKSCYKNYGIFQHF